MKDHPKKPILILPRNVSGPSIIEARNAGYLVIVSDEPDKIKLVTGHSEVSGGDLLMAAMAGVRDNSLNAKSVFVNELYDRLRAREVKVEAKPKRESTAAEDGKGES